MIIGRCDDEIIDKLADLYNIALVAIGLNEAFFEKLSGCGQTEHGNTTTRQRNCSLPVTS
jgi:hypothetical protein